MQIKHSHTNSKYIGRPGDLIYLTIKMPLTFSGGITLLPAHLPPSFPTAHEPGNGTSSCSGLLRPPRCSTHFSRSLSLFRCWKKDGSQMSWFSWHTCLQDCPGPASFTCRALRGGHITCPWQKSWNDKKPSVKGPKLQLATPACQAAHRGGGRCQGTGKGSRWAPNLGWNWPQPEHVPGPALHLPTSSLNCQRGKGISHLHTG